MNDGFDVAVVAVVAVSHADNANRVFRRCYDCPRAEFVIRAARAWARSVYHACNPVRCIGRRYRGFVTVTDPLRVVDARTRQRGGREEGDGRRAIHTQAR